MTYYNFVVVVAAVAVVAKFSRAAWNGDFHLNINLQVVPKIYIVV
jgi:hypothetical protein